MRNGNKLAVDILNFINGCIANRETASRSYARGVLALLRTTHFDPAPTQGIYFLEITIGQRAVETHKIIRL